MKIHDFHRCCNCHEKIDAGAGFDAERCHGARNLDGVPSFLSCQNLLCPDCANELWYMCPRHNLLDELNGAHMKFCGISWEEYLKRLEKELPERDALIEEAKELEREDEKEYYAEQERQSAERKAKDKKLTGKLDRKWRAMPTGSKWEDLDNFTFEEEPDYYPDVYDDDFDDYEEPP